MTAALALMIFVVAFGFIATEKANKVKVVLVAAGVMATLGLVPGVQVFFDEHAGVDWNIIFLLLGMMIIVGIVDQTGVFDYLAIWAAKKARGSSAMKETGLYPQALRSPRGGRCLSSIQAAIGMSSTVPTPSFVR